MPFEIAKDDDGGFWVQNAQTGRRKHKKPLSRSASLRYQRALEANAMGDTKNVKTGARNSNADMERIQRIHDESKDLGASCNGSETTSAGGDAKKSIMSCLDTCNLCMRSCLDCLRRVSACGDQGTEHSTCADACRECVSACVILADALTSGTPEEMLNACQTCMETCYACNKACLACAMICPECFPVCTSCAQSCDACAEECEIMGAMDQNETAEGEEDDNNGTVEVSQSEEQASKAWYEAFKKDEDPSVGGGVDRDKLKDSSFVFPDERAFPIVTAGDVSDAVSSWGRYKGKNSFDDFKKRLTALAKRKGFEGSLPKEWKEEEKKSMNLSYAKSLGLAFPDAELVGKLAVKFVGRDEIRHYSMLWGGPNITDIETEYFTKDTDFWDARQGTTRPLTWDHNQDPTFNKSSGVQIGTTVEWSDDEIGRWVVSKLDRAHRYRKAVDALIEKGVLGSSSDSALQYIERVKTGKSIWLKQWPWFATALTETPAEPRMVGSIEMLKSMGVILPDVPSDAERQRQLAGFQLRERELLLKSKTIIGG